MAKSKQPRKPPPRKPQSVPPFQVLDKVRFKNRDSAIYQITAVRDTSADLCMVGTDYFERFCVPLHELVHVAKLKR